MRVRPAARRRRRRVANPSIVIERSYRLTTARRARHAFLTSCFGSSSILMNTLHCSHFMNELPTSVYSPLVLWLQIYYISSIISPRSVVASDDAVTRELARADWRRTTLHSRAVHYTRHSWKMHLSALQHSP